MSINWAEHIGERARGRVRGHRNVWIEGEITDADEKDVRIGCGTLSIWCDASTCTLLPIVPPVPKPIPKGALVQEWNGQMSKSEGPLTRFYYGAPKMVPASEIREFLRIAEEYEKTCL